MRSRPLLFALLGGLVAAGAGFLACSSGGGAVSGVDAGMDTGPAGQQEATVFETSTPDVHVVLPDGGITDSGVHDAGKEHANGDAVAADAAIGNCSLVTGLCDIVAQNCEAGNECVVVTEPDASLGTQCMPTTAGEHLAKGTACCPSSDGTNPCDPGLECNGGTSCVGTVSPGAGLPPGWGGSRCTPRCCLPTDGGVSNSNCGSAGDGGTQGRCDLSISFTQGGPGEYSVCTYPDTCEPLGIHPCLTGFGCEVANSAGTASCVVIYNPNSDAGAAAGATCTYENQCADGLACIGPSSSSTKCEWMCLITGQTPPFDAGALNSMPGHGGCPAMQTCSGVNGFPSWLGTCG
jgi:hypothetical protein